MAGLTLPDSLGEPPFLWPFRFRPPFLVLGARHANGERGTVWIDIVCFTPPSTPPVVRLAHDPCQQMCPTARRPITLGPIYKQTGEQRGNCSACRGTMLALRVTAGSVLSVPRPSRPGHRHEPNRQPVGPRLYSGLTFRLITGALLMLRFTSDKSEVLTLDHLRHSKRRNISPRTSPYGTSTVPPPARRLVTTRMSTSGLSPSSPILSVALPTSSSSPSAGTPTGRPTSSTTAMRPPS